MERIYNIQIVINILFKSFSAILALFFYNEYMNLKQLRKYKGLTQEVASEICDIPLRTYKRLENDESYISTLKYKEAYNHLDKYESSGVIDQNYNILVIGAGYVGLSIATLLSLNNHISIVDINKDKVDNINNRVPLFKDELIEQWFKTKKLDLKTYLPGPNLYKDKDYIIVAIPTDYDEATKLLDTSGVLKLVKEIRNINKSVTIVIKSTCYIGFTDTLNDKNIIYCPEFLREGRALLDNLYPSRIVIGGDKTNKKVKEFAKLLQGSTLNTAKVLYMSSKEAEAVKLFSNTYLAMRVAYFNELDSFAMSNGINTKNIIEGVSLDERIGDYYNNPSFGYGGYCLPKDTLSLINQMSYIGNSNLISSIDKSNQSRKSQIVDDILSRLKSSGGNTVGIYSLESKSSSGNNRNSSILDIVSGLENKGIDIICYSMDMDVAAFKSKCDVILTNRYNPSLDDVKEKVYTRDLFRRD